MLGPYRILPVEVRDQAAGRGATTAGHSQPPGVRRRQWPDLAQGSGKHCKSLIYHTTTIITCYNSISYR